MRGRGKTKLQILEAPSNAIYVWCNSNILYPRNLSRYLGRGDIKVVSPSWVNHNRYRGINRAIVFDHAVDPMSINRECYEECFLLKPMVPADEGGRG